MARIAFLAVLGLAGIGAVEAPPAGSRPAAKPAPVLQTVRPVDPAVLQQWVQRLQERMREDIRARREPRFTLASMKSHAIVQDVAADGTMTLSVGGGELTYPWRMVTIQDLASIASGLPRGDDQSGQALAAFFLLASGAEDAGRERLLRSGAQAAEVERSFQTTASR